MERHKSSGVWGAFERESEGLFADTIRHAPEGPSPDARMEGSHPREGLPRYYATMNWCRLMARLDGSDSVRLPSLDDALAFGAYCAAARRPVPWNHGATGRERQGTAKREDMREFLIFINAYVPPAEAAA